MQRTILIGDVHGCIDELKALLAACHHAGDDHVILVGDLVAKGPDSQAVVQLARESGFSAVLGNHDDHVLHMRNRVAESANRVQHAFVAQSLLPQDVEWLSGLPLFIELPQAGADADVVVVHGGLIPGVPLAMQPRKHLLNLRSIRDDGQPSNKIDGDPWASRWPGPSHVVFGHDATRGLQQHPHATGLDTGCVYGNRLTALIWPERRLIAVPARRCYVPL